MKKFIEDIKFEIDYFWNNSIMYPIRRFLRGIRNFWYFRKEIWEFAWWDYSYFNNLQRKALKEYQRLHKEGYHCDSWNQHLIATRAVEILDEIEDIEENYYGKDKQDKINKLYKEFAEVLYIPHERDTVCDGKKEKRYPCAGIETLWD